MDSGDLIYLLIMIILLLISGLCSATETAVTSCSIIRIKSMAKRGNKKAKRAYKLAKDYTNTISTILILNNIVNTANAAIATYILSRIFGVSGVLYATIAMTIFILIFGEITPKILAKEYAEDFLFKVAPIFIVLVKILSPINFFIEKVKNMFEKKKKKITATEDELLEIVQTIEHEGVLKQEESELIQNAVEFDDKKVKDVMVSKNEVIFLYDTDDVDTIKDVIVKQKYSRIPVVCKKTNKVIGVIHEGDLIDNFLSGKSISIRSLLKDVIYLTKNRRLSFALEKIQKNRTHMAIVVDNNEDHNFLGIITLEDILEELVGEIYDEYDDLPKNVLKIGLHTYQIDPNIDVVNFFEEYLEETKTPKIESKTFIGWLNELTNNNIRLNQDFTYENIKIKVLEISNKVPTKLEIVVSSNYEEI